MHSSFLRLVLLFASAVMLATSVFGADRAWNTNPQTGYFSGPNWSEGTTGGNGTAVLSTSDSLYFDASIGVMLTNDLSAAEFEKLEFNEGASAYTIHGNWFSLITWVRNYSTSRQVIHNDILLTVQLQEVTVAAGGEVVLGGKLSGQACGLQKWGAGRLTLGGSNSFAGRAEVHQGTLALGSAGSITKSPNVALDAGTVLDVSAVPGGFEVVPGQMVSGRGTIIGPAKVPVGGTLAVSEGAGQPGVLTVNNGLTLEGTTLLSIRNGVGMEADKVQVTGESTSTLKFGGTLVLSNLGSFQVSDLPRTYTLFNAPRFSGRFSGLVIQPVSDPSVRVDISELREGGSGAIRVLGGNRAPKATNVVLMVEKNGSVSFELAKYASDPDGDLVTPTFDGVDASERVTFTNGVVTYRPAAGTTGNRVFSYRVSDPSGMMSTDSPWATISVTIVPATGDGESILSVSVAPSAVTVRFAGIPGGIYQGQYTSDLSGWLDAGEPATAGGNGIGTFVHGPPPEGMCFYRTRWVGWASEGK